MHVPILGRASHDLNRPVAFRCNSCVGMEHVPQLLDQIIFTSNLMIEKQYRCEV